MLLLPAVAVHGTRPGPWTVHEPTPTSALGGLRASLDPLLGTGPSEPAIPLPVEAPLVGLVAATRPTAKAEGDAPRPGRAGRRRRPWRPRRPRRPWARLLRPWLVRPRPRKRLLVPRARRRLLPSARRARPRVRLALSLPRPGRARPRRRVVRPWVRLLVPRPWARRRLQRARLARPWVPRARLERPRLVRPCLLRPRLVGPRVPLVVPRARGRVAFVPARPPQQLGLTLGLRRAGPTEAGRGRRVATPSRPSAPSPGARRAVAPRPRRGSASYHRRPAYHGVPAYRGGPLIGAAM